MNKEFRILPAYAPLFYSSKTYFLISGGRASGKTTQVAAYFLLKLLGDEFFRGVISRYSAKSIKFSIYQDIVDLATDWGVFDSLKIVGEEIINPHNDNRIITHSFKLPEGTQSAKGKGLARVTHLLIDEAQELNSEEEYIKVIDTFRTKGVERKIFIVFNPSSKNHWLHKRFYIDGIPNPKWSEDHVFLHTTYLDNIDNLDPKKVEEWERMQWIDPQYYDHHIMGHWRSAYEGTIYKGWDFTWEPPHDATTVYGLDWGFTNDPTACIEIKTKGDHVWLRQVFYARGLTNPEIAEELSRNGLERATIVADSSEPKSIEELRRLGIKGIRGAKKGPGSVITGIKKLTSKIVHVHPLSSDLITEYECYRWKPGTDIPYDEFNHALDAVRYAMEEERASGEYVTYSRAKVERTRKSLEDTWMYQ